MIELTLSVSVRPGAGAGAPRCVATGLSVPGAGVLVSRPLYFLVQLLQHLLAFQQHLEPHLLGGVRQDAVQTPHLLQLCLLLSVPTLLQLPDHPVKEGHVLLHGRELDTVVIHLDGVKQATRPVLQILTKLFLFT